MNAEHASKKKRTWPLIGTILLIIAAFIVGRLTVRHDTPDHEHDDHEDAPAARAEVWTCSMHPQVRQPEPGSCPICGMDLIPADDDDEDEFDDGEVVRLRVSPRAAALMEIQTWPAERRAVEVELRSFGRIDYDESRLVDVVARSPGYIERLHANFTLQRVAAGDLLADMYSPDVVAAMRELLVAQPRGGETLEAARARLVRMGVSPEQIDEVLDTGEVPRTYRVYSPVDGVVKRVGEREGQSLGEGGRIVQLADLSTVWVQLEAFETDLAFVSMGRPVHFTVQAYPGETFEGEVVYVDPALNARTRTVRFRAEVPNPDGRLKPGLFVRGTLHASALALAPHGVDEHSGHDHDGEHEAHDEEPMVIPASAPLITGRRALVYIKVPDADQPTFEPREVVLGPRAGDHYVVREGLGEGDLVVVHGQFKIDSELQIRGRPSMMAPEGEGEEEEEVTGDRWSVFEDVAASDTVVSVIVEVISDYLDLQTALSGDDAEKSVVVATRLGERDIPEDNDTAPQVLDALRNAVAGAKDLASRAELELMREAFLQLSNDAISLAPLLPEADNLFVMHCPMAFDFEGGDWLQEGDEVRNPYFGEAMLRCGEVRRRF